MFSLIRKLLSGITSMTSIKSEEKDMKMLNFTTNVPELDKENRMLFKAATILEKMGNNPGLTAGEFNRHLALSECATEDFPGITLAAIAIETMMTVDLGEDPYKEPTVH
jgi:hypothetical protein